MCIPCGVCREEQEGLEVARQGLGYAAAANSKVSACRQHASFQQGSVLWRRLQGRAAGKQLKAATQQEHEAGLAAAATSPQHVNHCCFHQFQCQ